MYSVGGGKVIVAARGAIVGVGGGGGGRINFGSRLYCISKYLDVISLYFGFYADQRLTNTVLLNSFNSSRETLYIHMLVIY